MLILFKIFERDDLIDEAIKVKSLLSMQMSTPPWHNKTFPIDKIEHYFAKDKKMISQSEINLVVIDEIGKYSVCSYHLSDIVSKLGKVSHDLRTQQL